MIVSLFRRAHDTLNSLELQARRVARKLLLRPDWPLQNLEDLLHSNNLTGESDRDLLYLPALPLDFRWQRPQQLAVALAERKARVTYLDIFDRSLSEPKQRSRWFGSRFCRLKVRLPGRPNVFRTRLNQDQTDTICRALTRCGSDRASCALVQHPLWYPVVCRLAAAGMPIVYDRIDWHPGFDRSAPSIEEDEYSLMALASAVIYSSPLLRPEGERPGQILLHLPNAAEHRRFSISTPPSRPVISYIGALDHWFDVELLERLTSRQPGWLFRIAGMCEHRLLQKRLSALPNVELLGEIPYVRVPDFFAESSLLLIPFRRGNLVDRVDPVKMYEAWAAGRPVVAPRMPSITMWRRPLLYTYETPEAAEGRIVEALAEDFDETRQRRVEVAADHSWTCRAASVEPVLESVASDSKTAGDP